MVIAALGGILSGMVARLAVLLPCGGFGPTRQWPRQARARRESVPSSWRGLVVGAPDGCHQCHRGLSPMTPEVGGPCLPLGLPFGVPGSHRRGGAHVAFGVAGFGVTPRGDPLYAQTRQRGVTLVLSQRRCPVFALLAVVEENLPVVGGGADLELLAELVVLERAGVEESPQRGRCGAVGLQVGSFCSGSFGSPAPGVEAG